VGLTAEVRTELIVLNGRFFIIVTVFGCTLFILFPFRLILLLVLFALVFVPQAIGPDFTVASASADEGELSLSC